MAVLNTTSPTERPGAPTEMPSNTVPSSRARIAESVTGVAYVGLQKTADSVRDRPEARGIRRAGMIPAPAGRRQWRPALYTAPMTLAPYWIHTLFEVAAYSLGFRLYLRERRRRALPALASREHAIAVGAGAIIGAALGSKVSYWLYDPAYAFAAFPDWRHLLEGKSIIGALLGGLCGVELAKRLDGVRGSTGDAFVLPLAAGMCIGRIGCFLAGLDDHTYGNPTALPW